jgi:hypothetical protein
MHHYSIEILPDVRGVVHGAGEKDREAKECFSERAKGFEPSTSALGRLHSTTELRPQDSFHRDSRYHNDGIVLSKATLSHAKKEKAVIAMKKWDNPCESRNNGS